VHVDSQASALSGVQRAAVLARARLLVRVERGEHGRQVLDDVAHLELDLVHQRAALEAVPLERRVFLFINVSALHQPNCIFLEGSTRDSLESHAAALCYVDSQLPPLFAAMQRRAPVLTIVCSDHGTAYGEDGFHGHRVAHPAARHVFLTREWLRSWWLAFLRKRLLRLPIRGHEKRAPWPRFAGC